PRGLRGFQGPRERMSAMRVLGRGRRSPVWRAVQTERQELTSWSGLGLIASICTAGFFSAGAAGLRHHGDAALLGTQCLDAGDVIDIGSGSAHAFLRTVIFSCAAQYLTFPGVAGGRTTLTRGAI